MIRLDQADVHIIRDDLLYKNTIEDKRHHHRVVTSEIAIGC